MDGVFYTTYDAVTFERGYRAAWPPEDGTPYTTVECTEDWCKPKFNAETQQWYNDATEEEQEVYLVQQEAQFVSYDAASATNYCFKVPQTNDQLNALYPLQGERFTLYCPNVPFDTVPGASTAYVKTAGGKWGKFFVIENE